MGGSVKYRRGGKLISRFCWIVRVFYVCFLGKNIIHRASVLLSISLSEIFYTFASRKWDLQNEHFIYCIFWVGIFNAKMLRCESNFFFRANYLVKIKFSWKFSSVKAHSDFNGMNKFNFFSNLKKKHFFFSSEGGWGRICEFAFADKLPHKM